MTTEEGLALIEKTRQHFSQPGAVLAVDVDGRCFYRLNGNADDPERCGFGIHIPDDRYDTSMEGDGASEVIAEYLSDLFDAEDEDFMALVDDIQRAHDDSATRWPSGVDMFLTRLNDIEKEVMNREQD